MNDNPRPEPSCQSLSETGKFLQKLTDWSIVPKGTVVELRRAPYKSGSGWLMTSHSMDQCYGSHSTVWKSAR